VKQRTFIGLAIAAFVAAFGTYVSIGTRPMETVPPNVPAERGALVDYTGKPLTGIEFFWQPALNAETVRGLEDDRAARLIDDLARELDIDGATLRERVGYQADELHLPARLSDARKAAVAAWLQASEWSGMPNLLRFMRKSARTYVENAVTAPVVGLVDADGRGVEGMELQLDPILDTGTPVRLSIEIDTQRAMTAVLNDMARRAGLEEANAVAIELATGRIAAIVSVPSFDPTDLPNRRGPNLRLKPATDAFQAGPMLQPFLLEGVLDAALPQEPALTSAFINGRRNAGETMVRALGLERATQTLERSGLVQPIDVDFPGAIAPLVRRHGTPQELLRDLGNGAGVAPSLLRYSTSLAAALLGTEPQPARIATAISQSRAIAAPMKVDIAAALPSRAHALRASLIERARRASGDATADFGGLWATYRDRTANGTGVRRGAVALFAPAEQPRYLIAITVRPSSRSLSAKDMLELGTRAIRTVVPPRTIIASS